MNGYFTCCTTSKSGLATLLVVGLFAFMLPVLSCSGDAGEEMAEPLFEPDRDAAPESATTDVTKVGPTAGSGGASSGNDAQVDASGGFSGEAPAGGGGEGASAGVGGKAAGGASGSGASAGSGGVCTDGEEKTVGSCEKCGSRVQTCQAGVWTSPQCKYQKTCESGTSESEKCGNCGERNRTCSASCEWEAWTVCKGQGECSPSATQEGTCGNCGKKTRTCSSLCTWGTWSSCSNQGVCTPGATEECCSTNVGLTICCKTKTCSSSCTWGPCVLKDGMECDWNRGLKCRSCGGSGYWEWCYTNCRWTGNCAHCPGCCNPDEPELYYTPDLPEISPVCE